MLHVFGVADLVDRDSATGGTLLGNVVRLLGDADMERDDGGEAGGGESGPHQEGGDGRHIAASRRGFTGKMGGERKKIVKCKKIPQKMNLEETK